MIKKLLAWFKKPKPTVVEEEVVVPRNTDPPKYSRATHKIYHEVVFYNGVKGRGATVRFYPYDNLTKPVEEVVEDSNQKTLEMKVERLIAQRMSKGKR